MSKKNDDLDRRYRAAVPPPAAPVWSRWHRFPDGRVSRELMPAFLKPSGGDGYAVKDSPQDLENERLANAGTAPVADAAPRKVAPPPVRRLVPRR